MKFFLTIVVIILWSCAGELPIEHAPYQTPDYLATPIVFAGGEITTTNGINFSKDGKDLYISKNLSDTFSNGRTLAGIFVCRYDKGKWSDPVLVAFDKQIDAYHPVLSADNKRLFFNSRSHPDSVNRSIPHNIWVSEKNDDGWANPRLLDAVNSDYYDSYPSVARNNNLYFNSDRPGGKGGMDIYMSVYENGHYQEPINLEALNSTDSENDLVVDPDERFIIFNRYIDATGALDLYISYKEDNSWGQAKELAVINKADKWELTPSLSPDGSYFFYELEGKVMQISLEELVQTGG